MSQVCLSEFGSDAEQQRTAVGTVRAQVKSTKADVNRRLLSARAVRGLEVAILVAVVICVVGLLSLPSVLYYVKKVSVHALISLNEGNLCYELKNKLQVG